jgi:hypothetical protein
MRVQCDRVAVGEGAADDRCCLRGQVPVDDEEGGLHVMARERVEQLRRGRRIGTVIEREVDGRRRGLRHAPDGGVGDVEEKGEGSGVGEDADCRDDEPEHGVIVGQSQR